MRFPWSELCPNAVYHMENIRCPVPPKFSKDCFRFLFLLVVGIFLCLADGAAVLTSSGRDDYEASAFLEQFRRQFLERQPKNFQSRDETNDYLGAPPEASSVYDIESGGGSGDAHYNRVYEPDQYRHRSPWALQDRRNPGPYGIPRDRDDVVDYEQQENLVRTTEHMVNNNNDDNQDDEQRSEGANSETTVAFGHNLQQQYASVDRRQFEDKFKVETRARVRQPPYFDRNSGSERPLEKSISSPASDVYFIAVVAGCSAAAIFGVMAAGFCWYKFQKNAKAAAEAEYPAYGVTGPNREHISPSSGGDRKLAQNANLFHYQHQKQQMIAMEKNNGERQVSTSDLDSEEENEEGDYTVYECPGLAPTGEMEVKNPLFQDEPTPASPPISGRPPLNSGTSEDSSK